MTYYQKRLDNLKHELNQLYRSVPDNISPYIAVQLDEGAKIKLSEIAVTQISYRFIPGLIETLRAFQEEGEGFYILDERVPIANDVSQDKYLQSLYSVVFHDPRLSSCLYFVQAQCQSAWKILMEKRTARNAKQFYDSLREYAALYQQLQQYQNFFSEYRICLKNPILPESTFLANKSSPYEACIDGLPQDSELLESLIDQYASSLTTQDRSHVGSRWIRLAESGDERYWLLYKQWVKWQASHAHPGSRVSEWASIWKQTVRDGLSGLNHRSVWAYTGIIAGFALVGPVTALCILAVSITYALWQFGLRSDTRHQELRAFEQSKAPLNSESHYDFDALDSEGFTLLMRLVSKCRRENDLIPVKYLLERGVNVNAQDKDGTTVLHRLHAYRDIIPQALHAELAYLLIVRGVADLSLINNQGVCLSDVFQGIQPGHESNRKIS